MASDDEDPERADRVHEYGDRIFAAVEPYANLTAWVTDWLLNRDVSALNDFLEGDATTRKAQVAEVLNIACAQKPPAVVDETTTFSKVSERQEPPQPSAEENPAGNVDMLRRVFTNAKYSDLDREEAMKKYLSDPSFDSKREELTFVLMTPAMFEMFLGFVHGMFPDRVRNRNFNAWHTLGELSTAPHCKKFGKYIDVHRVVFADHSKSLSCWESTRKRLMHDETFPSVGAAALRPLMADQQTLPIIAGESGSGKTHLLLTCDCHAITVYVLSLPPELKQEVKAVNKDAATPDNCDWIQGMAKFITTAVLEGRKPPKEWKLHLILAFDEMGQQSNALRLLCRFRNEVCGAVQSSCHAKSVRMIAAGTGVEMLSRPGSEPHSYKVEILKPDPCVWDAYINKVRRVVLPHNTTIQKGELCEAINNISNVLPGLVLNPRAAVILVARIEQLIEGYTAEVQVTMLRSSADMLLAHVASTYKAMGGMSQLDVAQTRDRCADAFRAVHCASAVLDEYIVKYVVALCGLITDNRCTKDFATKEECDRMFETTLLEEGTANLVTRVNEVSFHVTPRKGRFEMSGAIGLMILNQFGVLQTNVNSGTSEEAFEELVAAKIALTFVLTANLQEALEALGIPVTNFSKDVLEIRIHGTHVVKLRLKHRDEIDRVKVELEQGARAAVIINWKNADVIVALAGWLGFFHTRNVQGILPFAEDPISDRLWDEEEKCVAEELQKATLTELRKPDVIFVIGDAQRSELRQPNRSWNDVHVVVAASDVLKPFLWPQQSVLKRRTVLSAVK
jgi:hypothetical protein